MDWSERISNSKVDNCDGWKIGTGCKLFATLHKVNYGTGTAWLCMRCINKLYRKGRPVIMKMNGKKERLRW